MTKLRAISYHEIKRKL